MKTSLTTTSSKSCSKILQLVPPWECNLAFEAIRDGFATNKPDVLRELQEQFLESPLKYKKDEDGGKPFLLCEFNRYHKDCYRSPWTNTLHPKPKSDPDFDFEQEKNSQVLSVFESHVNEVWDAYRQLYYGKDAIGSVYLKEEDSSSDVAFLGVFLIQKETANNGGRWTSSHLVSVGNGSPTTGFTKYHIHSTVHVVIVQPNNSGNSKVGARLVKETTETCKLTSTTAKNPYPSHLENIGKLIESIEIDLRTSLEQVHFPKAKECLNQLRKQQEEQSTTTSSRGPPPPSARMMGGGIGMNPIMMGSLTKALSTRSGLKKTGKLP